jgi:hypothetical protein
MSIFNSAYRIRRSGITFQDKGWPTVTETDAKSENRLVSALLYNRV